MGEASAASQLLVDRNRASLPVELASDRVDGWIALSGMVGSGLALGLAFSAIGVAWLSWLALVPLLSTIERRTPLRCLGYSWTALTIFFLASLYWIVSVTGSDSLKHAVTGIGCLVFIAVIEGLFPALAITAGEICSRRSGVNRLIYFPIAWVAFEWLRSWFPIGFPWTPLGNAIYQERVLIQIGAIFGVFGLSGLIVLVNVALWRLLSASTSRRQKVTAGVVGAGVLATALIFGLSRISQIGELPPAGGIKVALVQGNIPQSEKWNPAAIPGTFQVYSDATLAAALSRPDVIIWPETATGFIFQPTNFYPGGLELQSRYWIPLTRLAATARVPLLIGAPAADLDLAFKHPESREMPMRNRVYLLGVDGHVTDYYDKIKLVPMAEYVPIRAILGSSVKRLVEGPGDDVPGSRQTIFPIKEARVGVLICYESIFPYLARQLVRGGANVLVNMTNDAWFGRSTAPYQLLAMTTMRAVENGVPIVRVANTGISAVIDPTGRMNGATELFTRTTEIQTVSFKRVPTFYTGYGYLFAPLCFGLTMFGLVGSLLIAYLQSFPRPA